MPEKSVGINNHYDEPIDKKIQRSSLERHLEKLERSMPKGRIVHLNLGANGKMDISLSRENTLQFRVGGKKMEPEKAKELILNSPDANVNKQFGSIENIISANKERDKKKKRQKEWKDQDREAYKSSQRAYYLSKRNEHRSEESRYDSRGNADMADVHDEQKDFSQYNLDLIQ